MIDFRQAHPDGVIVAVDQMRAYLRASLKRVWYPVGQTPTLRVSPQRESVAFYGALNVLSGQDIALSLPKMTAANTVHFLKHVMTCFPGCPILFLLDRASWHKGEARAFIEGHPLLEVIYFPPACPDLNPQEHVWKLTREAVGHLHDYAHIGDLRQAFQAHLDQTLFSIRWAEKYLPPIFLRS
jgi:transposase